MIRIRLKMNRKFKMRLLHVCLILILAYGTYHLLHVIQSGREEYHEVMRMGQSVAATIPLSTLKALDARHEDLNKPEYQNIKKTLASLVKINNRSTFAYIFKMHDGKIYFAADSEPESSLEYSPPGQEYTDATQTDLNLFKRGSQTIVEKSTDKWGKWISALVPIKDPRTHETIAVFGLDFNARMWENRKTTDIVQSALIVLLLVVAFAFLFVIDEKNALLRRDYRALKRTEEELIIAKEKAEESDRLKTSFLTNMSHEIRTPMNSILGFADLLKEPDLSSESREMYINHMMNSGERMLQTIQDIIELSKLQSGQSKLTLVRSNVGEQLLKMHEYFISEAKRKDLQLNCTIKPEDYALFYYTDSDKVDSILKKLIWNALKFTRLGSIDIAYKLDESTITYMVRDSGVGIDPVQMNYIFKFFRQGSEDLSRNYEGAGMGLAISKAYVELMGGSIQVESQPGKGSLFSFTIPFYKHEPLGENIFESGLLV
jgi:signal transduction histidine kinase